MEYALVNVVLGDGPDTSPPPTKKPALGGLMEGVKTLVTKTTEVKHLEGTVHK